ncbi:tyrosine-type recombinase/integrase [Falsihalocynthiibacter sp. BN13B15]|uniref:tyrosine-type recombinase/integrase n=1 Tax=Falsihalocynthiibacter sp. BN13B15 TaxID=3240871 RepID=UPI00350FAA81
MSRNYKNVRPKKHHVYTVIELMELFGICRNTVSNFVKEGLKPSDSETPQVFNGKEVGRFISSRLLTTSSKLRVGQFKCFSCKGRVFPVPSSVCKQDETQSGVALSGTCPDCERKVYKRLNQEDTARILACADTNTTLASLDEDNAKALGGIGNDGSPLYCQNDRIISAWLQYAGRYDAKTVNAHLSAIRDFEAFLVGKEFSRLTISDASDYREHLKSQAQDGRLSASTVRHRASHVKSFGNWLLSQKGCSRLDRTLPNYFELPKKFKATVSTDEGEAVPSLEDATIMVESMPHGSRKERRDRAMLAIAFLGALRADTVTSLRIKHFLPETGEIVQDAGVSRTKNGKSLRIKFFPFPPIFLQTGVEWKNELTGLGYLEDDALFPDQRHLAAPVRPFNLASITVMKSIHAVSKSFKLAGDFIDMRLSPHFAKYCVGQLSWMHCRTLEQQKAWSLNMGHDDLAVTQKYYSKIPALRISEIFDAFGQADEASSEDAELLLLYHEHELTKGSPDFERATRLLEARRKKKELQQPLREMALKQRLLKHKSNSVIEDF